MTFPITKAPETQECPRTRAVMDRISRLGYSAANEQVTTLCWELELAHDSLARELEQMREALTTLDARLRECMNDPIEVSEAYDSFYQDMVSAALKVKPSNEVPK